ncbi:MAG TPA: hypothetical protein VFG42_22525 [Baekduia sp.]|uniref:hypothetical protein n=1 Tax=Baekduia sp. TaxID=2600305 RepID=UPI002D76C92E|nr:hypothetical protein [Baekduia sp.]HET6509590.1 hypothetical protein [Baekduia sp.]
MPEEFEQSSRELRARLAPVVERTVARHRDASIELREPGAPMGVWFTLSDEAGAPLVLVSAHARAITLLLGKRGFLLSRDTASLPEEAVLTWLEDVLDAALGGGLEVDGDHATLRTRGGALTLR